MPRHRQIPSYRLHKPTGQAVVTLDGRDHYLGPHGTPTSRATYDRLIAEWLAKQPADPTPTIDELIVRYMEHARAYYRKGGVETGEVTNMKLALRPLHDHFGSLPAVEFGPRALKRVREDMLESGISRVEINRRVGRVRRMFRWAVAEELIPGGILEALKAVAEFKKGRTSARETAPVTAVPEAYVEAVLPLVSRQVAAMIELQRLTAMRPGEVATMRTCDLDMAGPVWLYRPASHKMEHHDRARVIALGPKAQTRLQPWLRTNLTEYLFQPKEAEVERRAEQRANRKSPLTPSQRARTPKTHPQRQPGDYFNTRAYAHAIARACRKAGIPVWGPNRLRHLAATNLRREFGLDVAQVVLGHANANTTLIYAEADRRRAAEAMLRIG